MRKRGRPANSTTGGVPVYRKIYALVCQRIQDGTYTPGMRLPPDTKFYKSLRVHKLTAVRALNALARDGILIRRQGSGSYVAAPQRPSHLPGRPLRIGILWKSNLDENELLGTFRGEMTLGALELLGLAGVSPKWGPASLDRASRADWTSIDRGLTVVVLGEARSKEVRHPPLEEIREARLDGLLTLSIIAENFLEDLLKLGLPTVLADQLNERFTMRADQVFLDPLPAHRAAVRHWASRGLRRIHFVGGFTSIPAPTAQMTLAEVTAFRAGRQQVDPDSYLRLGAWRQSMAECGLPAPESWAHFENSLQVPDAELAERLLALPKEEAPEAAICHSLRQASTILRVFEARE